jgi:DNA uptake protein ComE-like DNA-binding protein
MATININKATQEQLMTIRDIGATRATAIINERQNQFAVMLEKLKQIPGISAHIWDPLVSSVRITFEIREEEGDEFLRKMLEKFKTENVILKQADVTKIMEIKKMKTDFDTQVENLQTELGILVKQNEELTTKLQERETYRRER